jgi:phosphoribosylaminoimidazolecarboxamide formyltransferase/IMP cyclohydrolase
MKIRQALISLSEQEWRPRIRPGPRRPRRQAAVDRRHRQLLRDGGLPVTEVGDYTGFPEMLDGRVKTLHPKVHAGILARRDLPEHMATLDAHGIPTIDLVCVNLYPFRETVAKAGVTLAEAIENIDIGGPAMVRSSAKNYAGVAVVTDPEDYPKLLAEMAANDGELSLNTRFALAKKAFVHTARYDAAIANWLTSLDEADQPGLPRTPATGFRSRRDAALRRESAPAGSLLPRPDPPPDRSPTTGSCRARNCPTTTSPTPTPPGNASRPSTPRPA